MAETIKVLNIGGSEYNFNATQLNGFNINDICNKSGENIIVGSSTASIVSNWSSTGWSGSITTYEVENGIYEVHSYNGWRTHVYEIPSEYLNTTLSYSFDVYYDSEKSTQAINGEAGITSTKGYGAGIFAFGADILTKPDTWVHYSGSFTPTDTNKYFGFFLRCTDSSSKSTYIRVKNLKIEKGNLSSIWTPSIKDVGFYDFSNNGNFTKLNIGGVTKELTINYATSAGNAATATKATNDSDGNAINSTYSKVGHGHTVLNPERYDSNAPAPNSKNGLTFQFSYNLGTGAGGWWNVLNMRSYTDKNYTSAQIITPADNPGKDTGYSGDMKWRQGRNSTWLDWKTILDSSNYTSYTVKKDGTGASGVWGINVTGSSGSCTGNAATATNASNASQLNGITGGYYVRNIEGEDFNPTAKSGVFIGMSTQTGISSDWTHVISMNWSGSGPSDIKANNINPTWQTQLALPTQGRYKTQGVKFRTFKNGSGVTEAYPWTQLLDEFNYTTYCTPANIGAMPAGDTSHGTHVTTSAQTWSGKKTFSSGIAITAGDENTNMPYFLGIDAFVEGGTVKYLTKSKMCDCIGAAKSDHTHGYWTWNENTIKGVKVNNAGYADRAGSAPASDVYAWAKAANKPSYDYSEVGAPMHKHLFTKQDYQHYVVLLCKLGNNTTNINHTISGKIYNTYGGGARYQAADVDIHRSDWTNGNDSYTKFNPYGLGTGWELVTCTYNGSKWLAFRHTNTQACAAYFQGTAEGISFTAIKYYTSNTNTINNAEINNSINVINDYNRYAWTSEIPTIPTSLPANGGSALYADRLGNASGYYTKATLDTALAGKADSSHGTHVTTGAQSWSGVKTFSSAPVFSAGFTSNSNVTVTGKVSASSGFYEESDSRLKDFEDDINIDLDKIKQLPKKYFRWKEDPSELQIGTSAQAVQELYPELVSENENGNLTVAYDKLSVIALAAVDQLSTELNTLKDELQQIKAHLNLI